MPDPTPSLQDIQALRTQRTSLDAQLYRTQLELQKLRADLTRRAAGETVVPGDNPRVRELRQRIEEIEAKLRATNEAIDEAQRVVDQAKRSAEIVARLRRQIAAIEAQIADVRRELAALDATHDPDGDKPKALELRLRELTAQLQQLQRELGKASDVAGIDEQKAADTRQKQRELERERAGLQGQLADAQGELGAIVNPPAQPPGDVLGAIKAKDAERSRLEGALAKSRADLHSAIGGLYLNPHPADGVAKLDDGIPFLLMPVRIETRFVDVGNAREMWLRIYPDDIAIHTHEETLTDAEVKDGEKYWKVLYAATKTGGAEVEDRKKAAWSTLVVTYPPQRAAWVVLQTKPTNWGPDLAGIADMDGLIFPKHDSTKTNAWSRAPRTNVMPDKFVVILYEGGEIVDQVVGRIIPDELFVGPDPFDAKRAFQTKDTKLGFGDAYDWTSNFDKAIDLGLGFKIPLVGNQITNGFEKILVLGLLLSASETESQVMVEQLIDNHHYSPKGFSVVPQGTPTNNTDQNGSGYTRNDPFGSTSYVVEASDPLFKPTDDCDGRVLADALGIDYTPLQNIMHSDARDQREAVAMNKALYPGTLGYYFATLMQPVFDVTAQDAVRDFFVNQVTGRGPLPAIRVGDQPYGVLLDERLLQVGRGQPGASCARIPSIPSCSAHCRRTRRSGPACSAS